MAKQKVRLHKHYRLPRHRLFVWAATFARRDSNLHLQVVEMHLTPACVALSVLALSPVAIAVDGDGLEQFPLFNKAKEWYGRAREVLPKPPPVPKIPKLVRQPVDTTAAKIAGSKVTPLTISNYEEYFNAADAEYLVLVTGGNKTCGGYCHNVDVAWNKSAAILAADLAAPKMASIDCESQSVLCTTWSASPPTVWHINRLSPGAKTDIYVNYFNVSTVTAQDVLALHTGKKYEDGILLDSYFHPFDGTLAQLGLNKPAGYALWAFGLIPSWSFMILISMGSRYFM